MALTKFIRIPVQGEPTVETVGDRAALVALQEVVGGRVEAVVLGPGNVVAPGHALYLNEEGKLNGLPVNEIATRMTRGVLAFNDMIVGDVALVGPADEDGDETDPDEAVLERVLGMHRR